MDITPTLLDVSSLAFAVSSMLSVGLGNSFRDIVRPLRHGPDVVRALIANYLLVPLLAWVIILLFPLERPLAIGIFLIAIAAGAPFLIKLTQAAGSSMALSGTLLVLLLPVTIIYMPIVLPLALPEANVGMYDIAVPLAISMLLPLGIGLFINAWSRHRALRLQRPLSLLSTIALVTLIVATVASNWQRTVDLFGTGAILAALILIAGSFAIGYVLAGGDPEKREVLGLGTGQRNVAAATVVATQAIGDPATVTMVIVSSLAGFAVLFPAAAVLRRGRYGEQMGER